MSDQKFKELFVWNQGKIEDVRFWCEPVLLQEGINQIKNKFDLSTIDAFVGIEARGFYLAGVASVQYGLPTIMVRKHKSFFDKMNHESMQFTNWKGEAECLTVMMDTIPRAKSVVVVDDILDTGASLVAAKALLGRMGMDLQGAFYLLDSYRGDSANELGINVKSLLQRKLFS